MHPSIADPSPWVMRFAHLIRPGGSVLDLACGSGRHLRWLAARGHALTGVDRDAQALEPLRALGEVIVADIEAGPWPLAGRRFDAVIVTNYLWRSLLPLVQSSLAEGGVLIYETFALGNEQFGKPSNPDFLLRSRELPSAFAALQWVAYEEGIEADPPRCVQRLVAVKAPAAAPIPPLYRLHGDGG